jgi:hypothetical protein
VNALLVLGRWGTGSAPPTIPALEAWMLPDFVVTFALSTVAWVAATIVERYAR